jgi:hypothetical protein
MNERDFLYSLIAEHPISFDSDAYTFDRLVRAQHYEVPTRLLDLTSNALIALYFCCLSNHGEDGRVLAFRAPKVASKYFMSDCVSCSSNLVHLNNGEKHELELATERHWRRYQNDFSSLITFSEADPDEYSDFINAINEEPIFRRLVQFIKEEKPYFENLVDPIDLSRPYIVLPKKSNARIVAQSGAFVLFGRKLGFGKDKLPGIAVRDVVVRGRAKAKIMDSLDMVGIHEGTVFPEMDKSARRISKKLS